MGSSYTDFRGKGFTAKDGQVCVWLFLLVEEIEKVETPPAWLCELKKHFHEQSTLSINGCVNPDLDELVTDDTRTKMLIELAESALQRLREASPRITLMTEYSYSTDGPDSICNDVDIRIHERYGVEFIRLLKGEVISDELSTKAVWPSDL